MDTIFGAIIGVIGTLIGISLGGYISYKTSMFVTFTQSFNAAAADFRNAFTEIIRHASSNKIEGDIWEKDRIHIKLLEADIDIERAYIRFKHFLSNGERIDFKKAWDYYHCSDIDENLLLEANKFVCYMIPPESSDKNKVEIEKRELALERINNLLKFAKVKEVHIKPPISWFIKIFG